MDKELKIEQSIFINANLSVVWDALINPELIAEYFFGTEAVSTWQVGDPVLFIGIWDGKPYEDKGIVLKNIEEKELQYSYWSSMSGTKDLEENYAIITYKVQAKDKGTLLLVEQKGFPSADQQEHSKRNWRMVLENIKTILEG